MRLAAAVIAIAFLGGSCDMAPAATGPGAPLGSRPAAWDRARIVQELAGVGIAVHDDPSAAAPLVPLAGAPSPLALLGDQVDGLANELGSRGGVLGADLNDLATLPEGAPPFAYLVAGWLVNADTPEVARARTVIGDHDWRHPERIVFPNLVLLLFVADVARHTAADSAAVPAEGVGVTLASVVQPALDGGIVPGATVCSGLQGWVNSVLGKFFEAIKLQGGSGVVGFIVDIWNWAVELAKDVVTGLIDAVGDVALAAFRVAIGVVGTLSLMASLTQPWTVTLTPSPVLDHFTHPGEPEHEGTFTAAIKGSAEWAEYVVDCAKLAGITLPDPAPAGKRVTWKAVSLSPISVATVLTTKTDEVVRENATAVLAYRASSESDGDPDGDLYNGGWLVQARVERLSQTDLEKLFATVVFGGTAGKILAQLLAPLTQQVTSKLAALAMASGSEVQAIDYHLNDATPAPTGQTPIPTEATGAACLPGTWRLDTVAYGALLEDVLGGPVVALVPSGDQLRTYQPDGRVDFTFDGFRVDLLMAQTTPSGTLITEVATVFSGSGQLSYGVKVNGDGSLSVSYTGSPAGVNVQITQEVRYNGEVAPGAPSPLSIAGPNDYVGTTWTYHCQGNTLVEQSPIGPVEWRRWD